MGARVTSSLCARRLGRGRVVAPPIAALLILSCPLAATADTPPASAPVSAAAAPTGLALAHETFTAAGLDEEVTSALGAAFEMDTSPSADALMNDPHALTRSLQLGQSLSAGLEKVTPEIIDQMVADFSRRLTPAQMTQTLAYFNGPSAKALSDTMGKASMGALGGMFKSLPQVYAAAETDYCAHATCGEKEHRAFAAMIAIFGGASAGDKAASSAPPTPVDPARLALAREFLKVSGADQEMNAAIGQMSSRVRRKPVSGDATMSGIMASVERATQAMAARMTDTVVESFARAANPDDLKAALAYYHSPAGAALISAQAAAKPAAIGLLIQDLPKVFAAVEADYCGQLVCAKADHDQFKTLEETSRKALTAKTGT